MTAVLDPDLTGFDSSLYVDPDLARYLYERSVRNDRGCWIWQRALAGKGYAHIRRNKKDCYGHRLAFEALHGREPAPDLVVDHRECDTPACVNPEHVVETTHKVNLWRSFIPPTTCWQGHPIDRVTPKGRRYCSTCSKESNAKRKLRSVA